MDKGRMVQAVKADLMSLRKCLVLLPLSLLFTILAFLLTGDIDEDSISQAGLILLEDDLAESIYTGGAAIPILTFASVVAIGHIVVRSLARRRIAKRTWMQKFLSLVVHGLFFAVGALSTALLSLHAGILFAFVLASVLIVVSSL